MFLTNQIVFLGSRLNLRFHLTSIRNKESPPRAHSFIRRSNYRSTIPKNVALQILVFNVQRFLLLTFPKLIGSEKLSGSKYLIALSVRTPDKSER
ncbi:MAG: hypothetical protein C5B49_06315 [Bdellovibrio sp.]|nr:MAG: hypothetical protein C5B49_06315 [Bdellovibrio sp.]